MHEKTYQKGQSHESSNFIQTPCHIFHAFNIIDQICSFRLIIYPCISLALWPYQWPQTSRGNLSEGSKAKIKLPNYTPQTYPRSNLSEGSKAKIKLPNYTPQTSPRSNLSEASKAKIKLPNYTPQTFRSNLSEGSKPKIKLPNYTKQRNVFIDKTSHSYPGTCFHRLFVTAA
jgi:hypothetical protein